MRYHYRGVWGMFDLKSNSNLSLLGICEGFTMRFPPTEWFVLNWKIEILNAGGFWLNQFQIKRNWYRKSFQKYFQSPQYWLGEGGRLRHDCCDETRQFWLTPECIVQPTVGSWHEMRRYQAVNRVTNTVTTNTARQVVCLDLAEVEVESLISPNMKEEVFLEAEQLLWTLLTTQGSAQTNIQIKFCKTNTNNPVTKHVV